MRIHFDKEKAILQVLARHGWPDTTENRKKALEIVTQMWQREPGRRYPSRRNLAKPIFRRHGRGGR